MSSIGRAVVVGLVVGWLAGCSTAPPTAGDRTAMLEQASASMSQSCAELIVFEDKAALDRFKSGPIDLAADATAVILTTGAAANARFVDGVAVIVRPLAGAMAEASVGAQQFKFIPK